MADVRFTPAELKALADAGELDMATIRQMHPQDAMVATDALEKARTDSYPPGVRPAMEGIAGLAGGAGLLSKGAQAAKGALGASTGLGNVAKSTIGGYIGYEGVQSIGKALGLPKAVTDLLSLGGAHVGGGGLGKSGGAIAEEAAPAIEQAATRGPRKGFGLEFPTISVGNRTGSVIPDEVAEQVQRGVQNDFKGPVSIRRPAPPSNGRPGQGLSPGEEAGVQGLEELFQRTGNNSPNPMGHGTFKEGGNGNLGGPDTAGLRSQKNVSLKRTPADVAEQVKRGVNGDNMWQDPRSISLEYGNTPENERSVEAVQNEIKAKLDAAESTRKSKLRKPK